MNSTQTEHLVRMANQIALNMAAWGDEQAVARMTGEHIRKFWTPAMRERLLIYYRDGGKELSAVVAAMLSSMNET